MGLTALVALLLVAAAIGGYTLGVSSKTSRAKATTMRRTAQRSAYQLAFNASLVAARKRGERAGFNAGLRRGAAAGARAGKKDGSAIAARKRSATTAKPSSSGGCPSGLVPMGTQACVRPGTASVGGEPAGCGGNPYSTPSRSGGCIGPAHGPTSGPATNCPPGQVPAGVTGACAPPP